jgi:hypothetical protein
MTVPGSFNESDSDDHSSEVALTPSSSDRLSPSHKKPPMVNEVQPRTLEQITEEANMCLVSHQAFDREDPAFDQLRNRLQELSVEHDQALEGRTDVDWSYGPTDSFSSERGSAGVNAQEHEQDNDKVSDPVSYLQMARNGNRALSRTLIRALPSPIGRSPVSNNSMIGHISRPYRRYQRKVAKESPSHNNTADSLSVDIKTIPFLKHNGEQDTEQFGKKWSTVKVKSIDDKNGAANSGRANLNSAGENTVVSSAAPATVSFRARAVKRASRPAPAELKTFEEVHRQIREQDELTTSIMSAQRQENMEESTTSLFNARESDQDEVTSEHDQSEHPACLNGWLQCSTCAVCIGRNATTPSPVNTASDRMTPDAHIVASTDHNSHAGYPIGREGVTISYRPRNSSISEVKGHANSPVVRNGVSAADHSTLEPRHFVPTVTEHKKQAAIPVAGTKTVHHAACEDYSDSDSDSSPVPNVRKVAHRNKSSDAETAAGFASSDNTAAPDDSMVDEFLDFASGNFTRDEGFEFLRMCGANLVAAISMYRNARSPDHIRQMLRAWVAPLENDESKATARLYSERVRHQDEDFVVDSSEKDEYGEVDDSQSIATTMSISEAFMLLDLEAYKSVDEVTLNRSWTQLTGQNVFHDMQDDFRQAFETVTQYQDDNNCWELCHNSLVSPWTEKMDKKLVGWKTDEVNIKWTAIAEALSMTVQECKDRFKTLQSPKENARSTKEDQLKEQQKDETAKAPSTRAASPYTTCWDVPPVEGRHLPRVRSFEGETVYYRPNREHGAERSARNQAVHSPQSAWSFSEPPTGARAPEAPVPSVYTVTYWATVESGNSTVHVPIDSNNVSGPEKDIIEDNAGMKKVWKWVQEKGFSDKVSLQDAFDLAKEMHDKEEDDESVIHESRVDTATPRAFSRSRSPRRRRRSPAVQTRGLGSAFQTSRAFSRTFSRSPYSPVARSLGWSSYAPSQGSTKIPIGSIPEENYGDDDGWCS